MIELTMIAKDSPSFVYSHLLRSIVLAFDTGFDQLSSSEAETLGFTSTACRMKLILHGIAENEQELNDLGFKTSVNMPNKCTVSWDHLRSKNIKII